MVLSTHVTAAAGYIVKSITNLEKAKTAGKDFSDALWQWVRPLLLTFAAEAVAKTDNATEADADKVQSILAAALYSKGATDPAFVRTLKQYLFDIQNAGTTPVFHFSKSQKHVVEPSLQGDFFN